MKMIAIAALALLSTTAPAVAQQAISGLYNTGVDATGQKLSGNNAFDLHYLVSGAPTFTTNNTAYVQNPNAAFIASQRDGQGGSQTYNLTFNLFGADPNSASLSGDVAYDNSVTVLLNNHPLFSDITGTPDHPNGTYDAFQNLHPFSAGAGSGYFQNGLNTLSFQIVDYGAPTGLLVTNLSGSAVPEPGTWAMMLLGFGLVGFGLRYRRKSHTAKVSFA